MSMCFFSFFQWFESSSPKEPRPTFYSLSSCFDLCDQMYMRPHDVTVSLPEEFLTLQCLCFLSVLSLCLSHSLTLSPSLLILYLPLSLILSLSLLSFSISVSLTHSISLSHYLSLTPSHSLILSHSLGGTQSLHTNSFDEAMGLPTEFSARIAR